MPRMFDILNGKAGTAEPSNKKVFKKTSSDSDAETENVPKNRKSKQANMVFSKQSPIKTGSIAAASPLLSDKLMSSIRNRGIDDEERTAGIYGDTVAAVENLIDSVRKSRDIRFHLEELNDTLDKIFTQLVMGDGLLTYLYTDVSDKYYLPYHISNVLILSTTLGLKMGLNKSRLSYLGYASIFYDIGIDSYKEIICLNRALNAFERVLVKEHIDKSMEVVEGVQEIDGVVKDAILMHHERENGNGYPKSMKSEQINTYAKILALVDTYESMTNARNYRKAMKSHEVVKLLLNSFRGDFDTDVMKAFIDKMSIYPIGSMVKLDTGEVARVIGVQQGSPLRPVVMVLHDKLGKQKKAPKVIDLSKQDQPEIVESVK
ncbi:MAG: HD domain-containing protein [Candidatus Omnitrophica bacterium]|nr:HD domain-containing protein [Candidatus Omnitrophota bacterium]